MFLPIYTAIIKINPQLIQASKDLGANEWQILQELFGPYHFQEYLQAFVLSFYKQQLIL
ncbi:hypothetical protein ACEW7V_00775 [Areca yellow leaf disease phytoplasma]|uniref:hypothetical protein n=1 Tax=Areca yellow leaf disease phytoplasma TaxID=927614 RepID=UPI0035B55B8F